MCLPSTGPQFLINRGNLTAGASMISAAIAGVGSASAALVPTSTPWLSVAALGNAVYTGLAMRRPAAHVPSHAEDEPTRSTGLDTQ